MNKRLIIILLVSLMGAASSFEELVAQEQVPVTRSNNKVVIEGNVYYVHVVKPGQTLYSISKAYNVTEKEITIENPGITSNLSIGQVLKIPANPSAARGECGPRWHRRACRNHGT